MTGWPAQRRGLGTALGRGSNISTTGLNPWAERFALGARTQKPRTNVRRWDRRFEDTFAFSGTYGSTEFDLPSPGVWLLTGSVSWGFDAHTPVASEWVRGATSVRQDGAVIPGSSLDALGAAPPDGGGGVTVPILAQVDSSSSVEVTASTGWAFISEPIFPDCDGAITLYGRWQRSL